tara:strand:+ start:135 stop:566 length:432 start_codon:yes stop_codon:yes gene_type:complete
MLNKVVLLLLFGFFNVSAASDGQFSFIQKGNEAPFTGTLFDPEATARLLTNNKFLKEDYDLRLGFELKKQENKFKFDIEQINITLRTERESFEATLKIKNTEIIQLNKIIAKKPGSNALLWGIIGGFAVGVLSTVGITYAVNK